MRDRDDPILAYWKWLMTLPSPWQWPWDDYSKQDIKRQETHNQFPYIITIESDADNLFNMEEWCWDEFGPKHGKCKREACWKLERNVQYKDSVYLLGLQIEDYIPPHTGEHNHTGDWTTVWALKTSYDDGFCDFCFKKTEHAVLFKFIFGLDT